MISTRTKLALSLSAVSVVLGFMVSIQYKQQVMNRLVGTGYTSNDLTQKQLLVQLTALTKSNQKEQAVLTKLTSQLTAYEQSSAGDDRTLLQIQQKLQDERILAGVTAVHGPGIRITLMDGLATSGDVETVLTHDWDIRSVINELFTAGAEAVSINGYRVVATSGIFCTGPVVEINNHKIGAPFTISAIGDPHTLQSAMQIQGGVLDNLRSRGVKVSAPTMVQNITIPAYTGAVLASGQQ